MRVVVNATAALGNRTGVGHYTVELIRALASSQSVRLTLYPHPVLGRIRMRLGGGPRPAAPSNGLLPSRKSLMRRIARVPFRWGWRALVETEIRRTFHPHRVDLYHEPNFFPIETRVPTVVTVHDLSAVLHPEWHPTERAKKFESEFLPRIHDFAHILTDSDSSRDEIIRVLDFPANRITRAYPGIRETLRPLAPEQVAPVLQRLGLRANYFLHVGTIEPRKNLLMLLRRMHRCPRTCAIGARSFWSAHGVGASMTSLHFSKAKRSSRTFDISVMLPRRICLPFIMALLRLYSRRTTRDSACPPRK